MKKKVMIFHFQGFSTTRRQIPFQAWDSEISNSMTFQVFKDMDKPWVKMCYRYLVWWCMSSGCGSPLSPPHTGQWAAAPAARQRIPATAATAGCRAPPAKAVWSGPGGRHAAPAAAPAHALCPSVGMTWCSCQSPAPHRVQAAWCETCLLLVHIYVGQPSNTAAPYSFSSHYSHEC